MKIRPLKNKTFKSFGSAALELYSRATMHPEFVHTIISKKNTYKVKTYFKRKKRNYSNVNFTIWTPNIRNINSSF